MVLAPPVSEPMIRAHKLRPKFGDELLRDAGVIPEPARGSEQYERDRSDRSRARLRDPRRPPRMNRKGLNKLTRSDTQRVRETSQHRNTRRNLSALDGPNIA